MRKALTALIVSTAIATAVAGCSTRGGGDTVVGSAQSSADGITKAAYNDDYAGVSANFDPAIKRQIGRAEVGVMSDKMHRLGDYKGLTLLSNDAAKNEYIYRANFTRGRMNVGLRLDPDGKVAAYRIFVPSR